MNVLLPVDYTEEKKYPVLYILHGFFDNEDWMARPEVSINTMLANLQAQGLAKEMIIVLPYIFCNKELPQCTGMDLTNANSYDNFINDLILDVKPFVEKTFSVATGRENAAAPDTGSASIMSARNRQRIFSTNIEITVLCTDSVTCNNHTFDYCERVTFEN